MKTPRKCLLSLLAIVALVALAASAVLAADLDTTLLAQSRLRQLGTALQFYLNENGDSLDDPLHLWQWEYVSDPITFWHPGDGNPPPTDIENSVANALNSARISFEYKTCIRPCVGYLPDEPIVWDNTPDNNGGGFISFVTMDGAIETEPPNVSPVPSNVAITRARLRRLWWAIHFHAMNHGGTSPPALSHAYPGTEYLSARNYWNPGDSDPLPTDISNDEPNGVNSSQISFGYLVPNEDWDAMDRETIVLADNTPDNNGGYGINVINRRGHVRFIAIGTFGDADDDGDLDLQDYAKMQACFTPWPFGAILDDSCRILDWDGDDEVTSWNDRENFLIEMTGPVIH